MLEFIFEFEFIQRALLMGMIVGLITPLIGMFIVARRLSVIGEVLSNISLTGIAVGSIIGSAIPYMQSVNPYFYGVLFAIIGAFLVEGLRRVYRHFTELAIPLLLSFGLGLSVVLFSAMDGFSVDFTGYLFGNLLAVSKSDLIITISIGSFVLLTLFLLYKELLAITFDEEQSRIIGIRTNMIQIIFIILIALTISTTVRAVGVMLVSGLMVLPVAAGMLLSNGFKNAILYSIGLSQVAIIVGLILSYYFSLASGGAIIMVAFAIFLLVLAFRRRVLQ